MYNILTIAKQLKVNKVCIDGHIMDIRQLDKRPFLVIPKWFDVQSETIFNEPILYFYVV